MTQAAKNETTITLVCLRLPQAMIVDATAPCSWCHEECGLSGESLKLYRQCQGEHRIICRECYELQLGRKMEMADILGMMMTQGQLREAIDFLRKG